jgi:hypothetical protein
VPIEDWLVPRIYISENVFLVKWFALQFVWVGSSEVAFCTQALAILCFPLNCEGLGTVLGLLLLLFCLCL